MVYFQFAAESNHETNPVEIITFFPYREKRSRSSARDSAAHVRDRIFSFIFFSGFSIDAKTDFDFRYNYGCDDLQPKRRREIERERDALCQRAAAWQLHMRWETAAEHGAV